MSLPTTLHKHNHSLSSPGALIASFTALRLAQPLTQVGGGYETDVFHSSDHGLALKLKQNSGGPAVMFAYAQRLRQVADHFRAYLGPEHSLPTVYVIVSGHSGKSHVLAMQPFVENGRTLDSLDHTLLESEVRAALAEQLGTIVDRALACYRATGFLPDLYGLGPHDAIQARRWDLRWMLSTAWRMLAGRPLLAAHNLLLTADWRVVLVDYDPICAGWLSCRLAYAARALLLWRDRAYIAALTHP